MIRKLLPLLAVWLVAGSAHAQVNAVSLRVAGFPGIAGMYSLEYTRLFGQGFALNARVSNIGYTYEEDEYEEDYNGTGIGVDGVWYFRADGTLQGWYLGAGLDWVSGEYEWEERVGSRTFYGEGDASTLAFTAIVGYKIPLGDGRFFLDPFFRIGSYSSEEDEDGNREETSGALIAPGIAVGIRF